MILHRLASVGRRASGTVAMTRHAEGRVCALHGCATVLSVYNGSRFCALHERARQCTRAAPGGRSQSAPA